jgi:outer membrane lipase/esterase
MSKFRRALVAGAIAAALASSAPATAQFSGFYFFGDSLTDAGSYQPVLPAGVGRFTTNPDLVWAQVLGERYGFVITPANQGGTDYAYGGARIVLTPGFPNQSPTAAAVPIATQVAQQIGRGIDPGAVYALWGGANDVFVQLGQAQAGTITAAQAQAAVGLAATQYVGQVGALQAAGAQNIVVFNLPDIGRTPGGTAGGAAASAQISAITGLYNSTLQGGLNALGGNVIRFDVFGFFNEILANPSSFGFSNTTSPACVGVPSSLVCAPSNLVSPNANQTYVFADGVHPTGAAHVVIAQAVASLLEGPQQAATLTEGPLAVEQSTFRTVDGRMWSALRTQVPKQSFNLWTSFDAGSTDFERGLAKGDGDLWTFSFGGDVRINEHMVAGAAVNYSEFDASYGSGSHRLEELSGTIYAGWGNGPWYLGGSLLVGDLDFKDVRRTFDLGAAQRTESGDTGGWHYAVRLLGGYWMNAGNVLHGPFAKLVYQKAEIDNFAERAGTSTALRYGEQRLTSLISSVGYQAQGEWGSVRPFARVTWEHEFKDDARSISASPIGLGGTYSIGVGEGNSNWALFNVGASMEFGQATATTGRISGWLMGSATAGRDAGDSYAVTVGVRVPL